MLVTSWELERSLGLHDPSFPPAARVAADPDDEDDIDDLDDDLDDDEDDLDDDDLDDDDLDDDDDDDDRPPGFPVAVAGLCSAGGVPAVRGADASADDAAVHVPRRVPPSLPGVQPLAGV